MANLVRLRMLENLDGFLLVDKPAGIAFASVVKAVKRAFGLVKVGHGGALEAMASGLLVLLIGDANRYTGDVMGADRAYAGTLALGRRTNTHDLYGEPVGAPVRPDALPAADRVAAALADFRGDIFQTESRWCSVRREASAGYEIADTGEHTPFMAHVYRLAATPTDDPTAYAFEVKGTKGLLVRTLVNDLGEALGCGATLTALRRTHVGRYAVADAIAFDRLLETPPSAFAPLVLPLAAARP